MDADDGGAGRVRHELFAHVTVDDRVEHGDAELLRADLPADVRQVFSNNRSASLVNHLPAFERCY